MLWRPCQSFAPGETICGHLLLLLDTVKRPLFCHIHQKTAPYNTRVTLVECAMHSPAKNNAVLDGCRSVSYKWVDGWMDWVGYAANNTTAECHFNPLLSLVSITSYDS